MTAARTLSPRAFSYGGGVQSTAALVLAATGRIDFPVFLFANVGDDSEDPTTIAYVRHIAAPYAAQHGIALHELVRTIRRGPRRGQTETLFGRLVREGSRSLPIPVRMSNGAPGTRSCTADFKIKVVGQWLVDHGATAEDKATVGIGISLDEIHRLNNRRAQPYELPTYPLLDLDPPMRRADCEQVITAEPLAAEVAEQLRRPEVFAALHPATRADLRASGFTRLPRPGKSSCWFCTFHTPQHWAEMRRDRPEVFARACGLENLLNERRESLGKDPVWLTRFNRPLDQAVGEAQDMLPGFDDADTGEVCDNGACFT